MEIDPQILEFLSTYHLLAVFVGAALFGEAVIIGAGYLAAQLEWSAASSFIAAFTGTVLADGAWVLLGKRATKRFDLEARFKRKSPKTIRRLQKLSGDKPFQALLYIKFLYGTRILALLYLGWRRISWSQFFIYDAIGTLVWLIPVFTLGWLAGKSVSFITPALDNIEYTLLSIGIIIVLSQLITLWIKGILNKK